MKKYVESSDVLLMEVSNITVINLKMKKYEWKYVGNMRKIFKNEVLRI